MGYIIAPFIVGIICATIYGLFELFARRRERLAIIEKLAEGRTFGQIEGKFDLSFGKSYSYWGLRGGFLMLGMGIGLILGTIMVSEWVGFSDEITYRMRNIQEVIYGGSVLLCGGLGLLIAFLIEVLCLKKKKLD